MAIRNAKDFGTAIRERRKRLGYTQGELAEMCDVGVMFVSQLENGKPTAQLDKAIRVANMVGLNIVLQEIGRTPSRRDAGDDSRARGAVRLCRLLS